MLCRKDTQNILDNFERKPLAPAKEQRKPRAHQIVKQYANKRISKLKKGKWKWHSKAKSFQQDSSYQLSVSCGCSQLIKLFTAEKCHYSRKEIKINAQKWRKGWKSLVTEKWRTASFRLCSLLLLTLQGDPGCAVCKLYWNCIGINHMPEGSMACYLANDAVWCDGKEALFFLPPLIIFTTHRLGSDLTLVLYSDFADLCCHVTESKAKMLGWIHIQPVIAHLKAFCALHFNNTNDFC